jgi:hypothetical protein
MSLGDGDIIPIATDMVGLLREYARTTRPIRSAPSGATRSAFPLDVGDSRAHASNRQRDASDRTGHGNSTHPKTLETSEGGTVDSPDPSLPPRLRELFGFQVGKRSTAEDRQTNSRSGVICTINLYKLPIP